MDLITLGGSHNCVNVAQRLFHRTADFTFLMHTPNSEGLSLMSLSDGRGPLHGKNSQHNIAEAPS